MKQIRVSVEFTVFDGVDPVEFCKDFEEITKSFSAVSGGESVVVVPEEGAFYCSRCGELKAKDEYYLRVRKATGFINRVSSKCKVCEESLRRGKSGKKKDWKTDGKTGTDLVDLI